MYKESLEHGGNACSGLEVGSRHSAENKQKHLVNR